MSMAHADPDFSILALSRQMAAMWDREHLLALVDPSTSKLSEQA